MDDREALKGVKVPVLDHGHVILLDFMGCDADIVDAARTSYQTGTKQISDESTLLKYLMRHRHSTPFEMAEIKFHVRVPMDTWRQWIRHRTANVNEYSTRYSEAIDDAATTNPDAWRLQSATNKQGSGNTIGDPEIGARLSEREASFLKQAREVYEERLTFGVAREQARKDLPLSTYTEAIWKIDLHNLFHFLGLRMDSHAQKEIRDYATAIGQEFIAKLFPNCWEAFVDYRLNALTLHGQEIATVAKAMASWFDHTLGMPSREHWMKCIPEPWKLPKCRERDEFFEKLFRLGLLIPF